MPSSFILSFIHSFNVDPAFLSVQRVCVSGSACVCALKTEEDLLSSQAVEEREGGRDRIAIMYYVCRNVSEGVALNRTSARSERRAGIGTEAGTGLDDVYVYVSELEGCDRLSAGKVAWCRERSHLVASACAVAVRLTECVRECNQPRPIVVPHVCLSVS
eukprot:GHVU01191997.1.p1 GENE.GHVU01191997.1~~GHVU01191997.1.p1  ORF type:complete len:160 (+),score=9.82 GHVU01191997.1:297-776(+)